MTRLQTRPIPSGAFNNRDFSQASLGPYLSGSSAVVDSSVQPQLPECEAPKPYRTAATAALFYLLAGTAGIPAVDSSAEYLASVFDDNGVTRPMLSFRDARMSRGQASTQPWSFSNEDHRIIEEAKQSGRARPRISAKSLSRAVD